MRTRAGVPQAPGGDHRGAIATTAIGLRATVSARPSTSCAWPPYGPPGRYAELETHVARLRAQIHALEADLDATTTDLLSYTG